MLIGVCEDDEMMLQCLAKVTEKQLVKEGLSYEIITFTEAEKMLDYDRTIDILLLDIKLPGMSGVELKNRMLAERIDTTIIFVTGYGSFISEAFGINVFDFVMKDMITEKLPAILHRLICIKQNYMVFENGVSSKDILYIRVEHIYCKMLLLDGTLVEIRKSMQEMEKMLEGLDFVRIHRSYLVNMKWVEEVVKGKVIIGGTRLPVSRRLYKEVLRKLRRYWGKKYQF